MDDEGNSGNDNDNSILKGAFTSHGKSPASSVVLLGGGSGTWAYPKHAIRVSSSSF